MLFYIIDVTRLPLLVCSIKCKQGAKSKAALLVKDCRSNNSKHCRKNKQQISKTDS